jgi:uncharacterized YigZ family protein
MISPEKSDQVPHSNFYLTPAKKTRIRFTVLGSRFIATLAPATDEAAARDILAKICAEFPDATHHTYAYRIGSGRAMIERTSDDREPAGTAGAPMLQVLQGNNLSDTIIVGTRYFGGTKLGLGGLTRAYRDCARLSLEGAALTKREPMDFFHLKLAYEDLGAVTRLIESLGGTILGNDYTELVSIQAKVPSRASESLAAGFKAACHGGGILSIMPGPQSADKFKP